MLFCSTIHFLLNTHRYTTILFTVSSIISFCLQPLTFFFYQLILPLKYHLFYQFWWPHLQVTSEFSCCVSHICIYFLGISAYYPAISPNKLYLKVNIIPLLSRTESWKEYHFHLNKKKRENRIINIIIPFLQPIKRLISQGKKKKYTEIQRKTETAKEREAENIGSLVAEHKRSNSRCSTSR